MTAVSYHDRVNVLQGLALASTSPFTRGEWFALLAEEGGLAPLVALAGDGDQSVALPLMRTNRGLAALANWYSFVWQPLSTAEAEKTRHLLEALARDMARHWRRVTFFPVPAEDGHAQRLARAFAGAGWRVIAEEAGANHILHTRGRSYADYLATRPGPLRSTIERKARRLEMDIRTSFDPAIWAAYEAVYAASWKPAEGSPAMLRRFAQQEGEAGRLRLALARHDGRTVAAQLWTVEGGTAFIHKLAHTPDAAGLSPGTVLTAALMQRVMDTDRVALVDFGTGNEHFKTVWMEEVRPRYRIDCLLERDPRNWVPLARGLLRKLALTRHSG